MLPANCTGPPGQPRWGLPYTISFTLRIALRNRCRSRAHLLPPDTVKLKDAVGAPAVALNRSETVLNQSQGEMRRRWGSNAGAGSFSKYG